MSPKGLLLLLLVGLCAAQVAQADTPPSRHGGRELAAVDAHRRYERDVLELLAAAKENLLKILQNVQDAARSSVETVLKYYEELEAQVLDAGTEKLQSFGIDVNLTSVAALVKTNINTCLKSDKILNQGKDLLSEYVVCISDDAESLKGLMSNMQKMWATARALPATMAEVAMQCQEHAEDRDGSSGPVDLLNDALNDTSIHEALAAMAGGDPFEMLRNSKSVLASAVDGKLADAAKDIVSGVVGDAAKDMVSGVVGDAAKNIVSGVVGDALAEFTEDVDAHDLAAKANELLQKASRTMNKRQLWGFGRITRCVKAVYSLSKSDLVTVPGQMMAATSQAYRVYLSAQKGMTTCVSAKVPTSIPAIITITVDLGTCIAETNIDELVAEHPQLAGVKKIIALAGRIQQIKQQHGHADVDDLDFVPKILLQLLPPQALQALATATQSMAVYNELRETVPQLPALPGPAPIAG